MSWSPPTNLTEQYVAVIGAGTLGRRVGLAWAAKGGKVKVVDTKRDVAEEALKWIQSQLPDRSRAVKGTPGRVSIEMDAQRAVQNAWMVVECAPEIAKIKVDLLGQLDSWCPPATVIATISSSFKSSDLIGNVSEAGRRRVLNTHYFMPPEISPVEIMSSGHTNPMIIHFLVPKLREIGLDPIVVMKESTGFIFGRIWAATKREVMMVLADGIGTPEEIDKLFRYSFQSQGAPCDLMDRIGLETVCNIEDHYIEKRNNIPAYPVEYIRKNYVDKGTLGIMTGKGLFDYHEGSPKTDQGKQLLRQQLLGAWELVEYSAYLKDDPSSKVYPMGKDAQGIIMYTHTGYMSAQLQMPGQSHFRTNDLNGATREEFAEAGKHYLAYTGPFYLDESGEEPLLHHHMSNCSFPNWLGNTQRRLIKIAKEGEDDYLTLGPEGETMIMGKIRTVRLVWRRLSENHAVRRG
ncbi:MAG: hypothetical protein Q9187_001820 [Circinaria calcarea]